MIHIARKKNSLSISTMFNLTESIISLKPLKHRPKVWIVLFTCTVYRAMNLELVTNLSTVGFIHALKKLLPEGV